MGSTPVKWWFVTLSGGSQRDAIVVSQEYRKQKRATFVSSSPRTMPVATRANSAHYGISDETLMVGGTRSNDLQDSRARGQAHPSITNEEMTQRLLAIREQHASNAYAAQQQRTRTASTCLDADCISPLFNVSTAAAQPNRPAPSTAPAPRITA